MRQSKFRNPNASGETRPREKRDTTKITGAAKCYACHNCKFGLSEECLTCQRVDKDDEAISRDTFVYDSDWAHYRPIVYTPDTDEWDEKAERTLQLFHEFCALEPLQLLAVLTIARGGMPSDIPAALMRFVDKMRRYVIPDDAAERVHHRRADTPTFCMSRANVFYCINRFMERLEAAVSVARLRGAGKPGRIVYNADRLWTIAQTFLQESDIVLMALSLKGKGLGLTDIGMTLGELAEYGGAAETLAAKLSDPENNVIFLWDAVTKHITKFAPYSDLIRVAAPDWHYGIMYEA